MIKNIKFSFIKTLLILGVFVVLIGSLLMMQAKDTSAESSPEVVLNKYLTAHKNKDIMVEDISLKEKSWRILMLIQLMNKFLHNKKLEKRYNYFSLVFY